MELFKMAAHDIQTGKHIIFHRFYFDSNYETFVGLMRATDKKKDWPKIYCQSFKALQRIMR